MPDIFVDNRPPSLVFDDTNRLSDAMYNFGNAMASAPAAAAKIRAARQQQDIQNAWKERELAHLDRQDDISALWRQQQIDLARSKLAAGEAPKPPPGYVVSDLNRRVDAQAQRQGLMRLDEMTGKLVPAAGPDGVVLPENANALDELRTKAYFDAGINPSTYERVGAPVPLAPQAQADMARGQQETELLHRAQKGDPQAIAAVSALLAADGQKAPTAQPAAIPPAVLQNEVHHADQIAQMYAAGDREHAAQWIAQMRSQHGDEFTDRVKERVRAVLAQQPQQQQAP